MDGRRDTLLTGSTPQARRRRLVRPARRWSRPHTAATALLTPLWYAGYRAAVGVPAQDGLTWTAWLLGLAVLAAATVSTYLPGARGVDADCSIRPATGGIAPCAATPLFSVVLAAVVLNGAVATPFVGAFALVLIVLALAQRLFVPGGCGG